MTVDDIKEPFESHQIELSPYSKAFLSTLTSIKKKVADFDAPRLSVSPTVSFFAVVYEKIRNAVEFKEEHLVRRSAIARILSRRLSLNNDGHGEAENLLRELLWARYLPGDSVTFSDVEHIQSIIDKYLLLRNLVLSGRSTALKQKLSEYLMDFLSCEIEEELNIELSQKKTAYLHFFYQVLKNKVDIKNVERSLVDSFFYVAAEIAFSKSDRAYIRFHLFQLINGPIQSMTVNQVENLSHTFLQTVSKIETIEKNPYTEKLVRFAKKQTAPFLILFTIADKYPKQREKIFTNSKLLWERVDSVCREKYQEAGIKLRNAAVRSIIYIFFTKALFALLLEYPLSLYFYGQVHLFSIAINTLFPPLLMGLIISFVRVPGEKNTKKIYERIVNILNKDPSFEITKNLITGQARVKRPLLLFGFTVIYLLTFGITFLLIYQTLFILGFNLIGMAVFVFFVSLVAFFGYRIRQTTKEYTLIEREGVLSPLIDFFFLPILFVGKFLSQEIAKLNIFVLIFDFLIEAPFKLISEIVEEWINFVKARKEEIG